MNMGFVVCEDREKTTIKEISEVFDRIVNGQKLMIKSKVVFLCGIQCPEKKSRGSGIPLRICCRTAPMAKSEVSVVN